MKFSRKLKECPAPEINQSKDVIKVNVFIQSLELTNLQRALIKSLIQKISHFELKSSELRALSFDLIWNLTLRHLLLSIIILNISKK